MESHSQTILKTFLIDKVLSDCSAVTSTELNLLRQLIKDKLKDITIEVSKFGENTSSEQYRSMLITSITLKCILSLIKKIEKENEYGTF